MMTQIRSVLRDIRSSFWFLPSTIVMSAVLLALILIMVDANLQIDLSAKVPIIFGASAAGSRGLLTAVAGSMITVAGLVFSITIVALTLTSSQYTSRVLRNFMRDRANQTVLGVFLGIFAYCLVVLRTIYESDESAFVSPLAVLGGLLLAFLGIGYLIFFIHHISTSIQASNVIASAAHETLHAVEQLFPETLDHDADDASSDPRLKLQERRWIPINSQRVGYIQTIDTRALLQCAHENDIVVRMEQGVGAFVVPGTPLLSVSERQHIDDELCKELHAIFVVRRQRTVEQDVGYGIRQLLDIAIKALSPGINDPTTAVMCVDYLSAVFVRLAPRVVATPHVFDDEHLRIISTGATFESLLHESFDELRYHAREDVVVLAALVQALETIALQTRSLPRRNALSIQARRIAQVVDTSKSPIDRDRIDAAMSRLSSILTQTPGEFDPRPPFNEQN